MVSKISLTTSKRSSISTVTSRAVMILLKATGTPPLRMLNDSSLCADAEHRLVVDAHFGKNVRPRIHRRIHGNRCTGNARCTDRRRQYCLDVPGARGRFFAGVIAIAIGATPLLAG